jgi:dipeptidyl aminopeptidase/acylaminoacyl peptidase
MSSRPSMKIWLFIFLVSPGIVRAGGKKPITVEDCVCLKRIIPEEVQVSPDLKLVAYLLKAPNLETNTNAYQLWVRDLRRTTRRENGDFVFQSTDQLSGLHWLADGERIALLVRGRKTRSKILFVNTKKHLSETVLEVAAGIGDYSVDSRGDVVAYTARRKAISPNNAQAAKTHGYSIPFGWPIDLFLQSISEGGESEIHVLRRGDNRKTHESSGPTAHPTSSTVTLRTFDSPSALSLSPDGRYLCFTHVLNQAPVGWQANRVVQQRQPERRNLEVEGLYDLRTSEFKLALNSPYVDTTPARWSDDSTAFAVFASSPIASIWETKDSESSGDALARHLFAVDLPSGTVSEVLGAPVWARDARIITWRNERHEMLLSFPEKRRVAHMHLSGIEWREGEAYKVDLNVNQHSVATADGNLLAGIQETLTVPPDLFSYSVRTGSTVLLTDLNPGVRQLALGDVEKREWTNRYGGHSYGYLVKPTAYQARKRYPLVIMAKGWSESFICDSSYQTAFAPQPLAALGFAVLEVNYPAPSKEFDNKTATPGEVEYWSATIESAMDLLVAEGLVDRNNIGISGFSRTSWYVDYLLSHAKYGFKAASSADSGIYNYGLYWLWQYGAESEFESFYGGPPYGETLAKWIKYAPAFSAGQVDAPLLMEYMGGEGSRPQPFDAYEFFTALRRLGKPVDLFFYPSGEHELDTPFERVASLQRNVDWFRFWMQGAEGKVPPYDSEQYLRWRKLRQQQEWNDRMREHGKDPSAEFMRQTSPAAIVTDADRAPAARDLFVH